MENQKSNKGLIALVVFLLLLVCGLGGYIYYDKVLNKETKEPKKTEKKVVEEKKEEEKKSYENYVGTWYNKETQDEISIKNVTDNEITFSWFIYRIASIDNDTTISFKDGKGIFYFEGHSDKNFDGKLTEDENFIKKTTIDLTNNGVNVIVEDVTSADSNYTLLNKSDAFNNIETKTYNHPEKK